MIKKLLHTENNIAIDIRQLFQKSYAVEAELLNAIDFPPLRRPLEDFISSPNTFYGYFKNDDLAGAIEIKDDTKLIHIQSLVVNPTHFRKGIGRQLMQFVMDTHPSDLYMVETGIDNEPAVRLYKILGFIEVDQWDTNHSVRKVRFEKRINNL